MKNQITLVLLILLIISSCQKTKDFVELSGMIINPNSDSLVISNAEGYSKTISVHSDGSFSDTLKVNEGRYRFYDGKEMGTIFLKNGNTTSFNLETKTFDESLKFEGDDAEKSNVLAEYTLLQERFLTADLFDKNVIDFQNTFKSLQSEFKSLKAKYPTIDSTYFAKDEANFKKMKQAYEGFYNQRLAIRKELPKGAPSPTFSNYENHNGETSSLSDFKGQYVYIDIWATWCAPCKAEIPFLKKLEAQYHDRNIEFISISVDDAKTGGSIENARAIWKKMVTDENLTGVQLFTGNGFKADFIKSYKITGIPRFILIDPNGHIINADAPRPSSQRIIELFEELGI